MDKPRQDVEWDGALRQIAEGRDRLLRDEPELSSLRRAILATTLAREFPVEAALLGASGQRDRLLAAAPREIPRAVRRDLRRSLTNAQPSPVESRRRFFTRAALLAACLVAGLVLVFFGKSEPAAVVRQAAGPGDQLSLRMSAAELTSLRATFLASNPLEESADASARLRLDLPVRAFLRGDAIASTP